MVSGKPLPALPLFRNKSARSGQCRNAQFGQKIERSGSSGRCDQKGGVGHHVEWVFSALRSPGLFLEAPCAATMWLWISGIVRIERDLDVIEPSLHKGVHKCWIV